MNPAKSPPTPLPTSSEDSHKAPSDDGIPNTSIQPHCNTQICTAITAKGCVGKALSKPTLPNLPTVNDVQKKEVMRSARASATFNMPADQLQSSVLRVAGFAQEHLSASGASGVLLTFSPDTRHAAARRARAQQDCFPLTDTQRQVCTSKFIHTSLSLRLHIRNQECSKGRFSANRCANTTTRRRVRRRVTQTKRAQGCFSETTNASICGGEAVTGKA